MSHDYGELIDPTVELNDIEELLVEYRLALEWMGSLTRLSPHSRWRQYETTIRNIIDMVKHEKPGVRGVLESDARNAYYEVAQFRTIYRQFKDASNPVIAKKLALIAKGNVSYTEEQKDARSRDTAFELFLAASFQEAGLRISLGNDTTELEDFRVMFDDFDLYVECKRPQFDATVRTCTDVAFKQLELRLRGAQRQAFGAVAFAIDRAKNPTSSYIKAARSEFITDALTSRTADFILSHSGYWNQARPDGVILAFIQLSGSAYVGELPFGIFSSVVTVERLPPLTVTPMAQASLRAMETVFQTLGVDQ